jgi:hypothetical protein
MEKAPEGWRTPKPAGQIARQPKLFLFLTWQMLRKSR